MASGYYYLAGPMRGYPEFNFPAFKRAAAALRAKGIGIVSPAEKDEQEGFDWSGTTGTDADLAAQNFDIAKTLQEDIALVGSPLCLGVICLAGWERSSGARAETAFAWAIGKKVLRYNEPERWNGFNHSLEILEVPAIVGVAESVLDEWEV